MIPLLSIFAAPTIQVIGYLLAICVVGWILWALLTNFIPPNPPAPRNLAYVCYVVIVGLMLLWWCDFAFGLGLF